MQYRVETRAPWDDRPHVTQREGSSPEDVASEAVLGMHKAAILSEPARERGRDFQGEYEAVRVSGRVGRDIYSARVYLPRTVEGC